MNAGHRRLKSVRRQGVPDQFNDQEGSLLGSNAEGPSKAISDQDETFHDARESDETSSPDVFRQPVRAAKARNPAHSRVLSQADASRRSPPNIFHEISSATNGQSSAETVLKSSAERLSSGFSSQSLIRSRRQEGGRAYRCPLDARLLLRLIALHDKRQIQSDQTVSLHISGVSCRANVVDLIDIGSNIKCLIIEEPFESYRQRLIQQSPEDISMLPERIKQRIQDVQSMHHSTGTHTIFAFNWFSPKNIFDYVKLGIKIATQSSTLDPSETIARIYLDKAEEFLYHDKVLRYLGNHGFDLITAFNEVGPIAHLSSGSRLRLVTVTGFSLGAAIAHAFAYILKGFRRLSANLPIRCVGFGSPRPGSPKLSEWFERELVEDSINVVLSDEIVNGSEINHIYDPVCVGPPQSSGFDFHPCCQILHKRFGTLRPLSEDEEEFIRKQTGEKTNRSPPRSSPMMNIISGAFGGAPWSADRNYDDRLWDMLHGVAKYYAATYGLSDD